VLLPVRRSMVKPSRFSVGTNCMTMLSVTMRTASLSTCGTPPRNVLAGSVLALAASVAIIAVTKPAPPEHKLPTSDSDDGATQLQRLNSMWTLPANEFRGS
jgi:hypothetical protein